MEKTEPIQLENLFNSPYEKVWQALTHKDQMKQWYFDVNAFKPEVGFEFQFQGGDGEQIFRHLCRITEVVPRHKISYSWCYEGYEGHSEVTFELFPEGEKTRLRLTHTGLETFPAQVTALNRGNFVTGWNHIIYNSLKNFLENTLITRTIAIDAPPERVWKVLVKPEHNRIWSNVFSAGTYVESDWQPNAEVCWKDQAGHVSTKGVVEISEIPARLKVLFYDEADMAPPAPAGPYAETYTLTPSPAGTLLHIEAGPLPARIAESHGLVWEKALETMKNLAEQNSES